MATLLYPYKPGSAGARQLAEALDIRRIKHNTIRYNRPRGDTIINWGASDIHFDFTGETVFNYPAAVRVATNKLLFFRELEGNADVRTVPFTEDPAVAREWDKGVARTLLRGSEGRGIVVFSRDEPLPEARLYTKYTPKVKEFRVHVCFGRVIDTQRKIADPNNPPTSFDLRNHDNGFLFARNSGQPTPESMAMAVHCVSALGLDFGAVDVIENKKGSWILEVNTAPGLEGQTLEVYRSAFEQKIRDRR